MVAEHAFRPDSFHRNVMSELMRLVPCTTWAKASRRAASIHNCMSAHGPDLASYEKNIEKELAPAGDGLAFMWESLRVPADSCGAEGEGAAAGLRQSVEWL
jgi:homogentisate 1,2-dioxygenase